MLQPNKNKRPDTPLASTPTPVKITYSRFDMAREATNRDNGVDANTPATKKDSMDFRAGFAKGVNNKRFSAKEAPYGENEYQKMGRWEGQKAKKKK